MDDKHAAFCLAMCSNVTGFVAIDVSQRQWPNETDTRDIAGAATRWPEGDTFDLREEDSYAYVKRVALGFEPLHEVSRSRNQRHPPVLDHGPAPSLVPPGRREMVGLPKRIEDVIEATAQADLDMLPGLVLRSRRLGSPRVFGEIGRG